MGAYTRSGTVWLVTNSANLQRPPYLGHAADKRLREADMGKPSNPRLLRDNEAGLQKRSVSVLKNSILLLSQYEAASRALAELSFSAYCWDCQERPFGSTATENNHQLDVDRLRYPRQPSVRRL